MKQDGTDCVDLDAACKLLAKSSSVQALVKTTVGAGNYKQALAIMRAGKLEGALGGEIHDLLADAISNQAEKVWSGIIRPPHDDYTIQVKAGMTGSLPSLLMTQEKLKLVFSQRANIGEQP